MMLAKLFDDEYYVGLLKLVSTRSTCDRGRNAAIVVDQQTSQILGIGVAAPKTGELTCDEVGHRMRDGHCVRTLHAEYLAIQSALTLGLHRHLANATIYTTTAPCISCAIWVKRFGLGRVVYVNEYQKDEGVRYLQENGYDVFRWISQTSHAVHPSLAPERFTPNEDVRFAEVRSDRERDVIRDWRVPTYDCGDDRRPKEYEARGEDQFGI